MVLAPVLIVLANIVLNRFFRPNEKLAIPEYKDISTLLGEDIDANDWDRVIRFVNRAGNFRNIEGIAVFRDDYLVIYSTLQDFKQGDFASNEAVKSLLQERSLRSIHDFVPIHLRQSDVYMLSREASPPRGEGRPPPPIRPGRLFYIIIFVVGTFTGLLAIFSICMSIVIARTITRSVQVLENATRRIAEGDLDLNVDVKGSNEITSLTNSLNKMRNALKEEELRRSRFIMGITHDLKTPLALIRGYAEAIDDGITDNACATKIIVEKADQLGEMINDLLEFVRMETGQWRARLESVNLSAFLQKMVAVMGNDVELLQHSLTGAIDLPEELFVPMDEKLALRAFENLIHNAVRYTPQGSLIRIAASCTEKTVEITVSDNGPGIDKEALSHIFEMFYRGSSSRREQGLGLGLAVVKWIVDYHGWTIAANSEKGQGTSFSIRIDYI
jgi:signal transduction histidine kinase